MENAADANDMRHYNATSNTCNRGATGCGFPSQVGFRLHINGTLILLYVLRKLTIFFLYFVGCLKTYGCHKWQSNHHRWNQTRKSIYSDIRISDSLLFALGCRYASAQRGSKVRRTEFTDSTLGNSCPGSLTWPYVLGAGT